MAHVSEIAAKAGFPPGVKGMVNIIKDISIVFLVKLMRQLPKGDDVAN